MPRLDGLLVIAKPGGMTSRAALDQAQRWFPRGAKLGHAGTLDPLATGVLVACVGAATRLVEYVQRMDKVYLAGILLGARSTTDDADGDITPAADAAAPELASVEAALAAFLGDIEQTPPAFSAAHVGGRRAYDLARAGRNVDLAPRPVHIHEIDLLAYAYPRLEVRVRCGKGTYIRSLARDLGDMLGCGGYIASLRRTRIGVFAEQGAVPPGAGAESARCKLRPLADAVYDLPKVTLPEPDLQKLRQGQNLVYAAAVPAAAECAVFSAEGELVAVARTCQVRNLLIPHKVMTP